MTEEEGHLAAYWGVLSKDFLLRTFLCLSPLKFLEDLSNLTDIPKEGSFFFLCCFDSSLLSFSSF